MLVGHRPPRPLTSRVRPEMGGRRAAEELGLERASGPVPAPPAPNQAGKYPG